MYEGKSHLVDWVVLTHSNWALGIIFKTSSSGPTPNAKKTWNFKNSVFVLSTRKLTTISPHVPAFAEPLQPAVWRAEIGMANGTGNLARLCLVLNSIWMLMNFNKMNLNIHFWLLLVIGQLTKPLGALFFLFVDGWRNLQMQFEILLIYKKTIASTVSFWSITS